jgi:nickel-dependent lactate racemase
MPEVWFPYGKTEIVARLRDENLLNVVYGKAIEAVKDSEKEISTSIDNPIGSEKLKKIVDTGKKVAIVIDGRETTPNNLILKVLLVKLNDLNIKNDDITVIIGCLYEPKEVYVEKILEKDIIDSIPLEIHDPYSKNLVHIGNTSRKKIYLNKTFSEADVKILTGKIDFHYFAGYQGGMTSTLHSICDSKSIQRNSKLLIHPKARTGNLEGNPVYRNLEEVARLARVSFSLNVITNNRGEIVKAFAGDLKKTFLEGVKLIDERYKIPVKKAADIVIVSPGGYPKDVNLFKAFKAIDSSQSIVKRDGVIILLAECVEGYGNEVFYEWTKTFNDEKAIEKEIKQKFRFGGHIAYYLSKIQKSNRIILVSAMPDYYSKKVFKLMTAKTANTALKSAFKIVGNKAKVLVVPDSSRTLPFINKT